MMLSEIETTIESYLNDLLRLPVVHTLLIMFLSIYAGKAAPQLTPQMQGWFSSDPFRLLVYFMIAYGVARDTETALIATVVVYFGAELLPQDPAPTHDNSQK